MSQIENCPICGKLYTKNPFNMCIMCYQEEEKNEQIIAGYVREHPNTSLMKIHQDTGIKESTILRMIKAGRFIGIGVITYSCERCGAPIVQGRFCQECNEKFLEEIQQASQKNVIHDNKGGMGMYTNFYKKREK